MTQLNTGVKVRLALIGRAVWEVVAIADRWGGSVWEELQADPGDYSAEAMRATLETDVPLNGPPRTNKRKCVDLGAGIYEFKEPGWRVLWFYDAGDPKIRRRIVCTHATPKVAKKEFQKEIKKAIRMRDDYIMAKSLGRLMKPGEAR